MVFSSSIFLFIFLPLVIIAYYNPFFRSCAFKNGVLLVFSLAFYAYGEPVFVFVMLFSILLNYFFGLAIAKSCQKRNKTAQKAWLALALLWNVGLLFVFKYLSFLANAFAGVFAKADAPAAPRFSIALPIGISFFTFQILSYIFDVYYGKAQAQKNAANLALYISLFPQLIAGPIVRYDTIESDITGRVESAELVTRGVVRFVYGLAKKCLVANYVAVIADLVFNGFDAGIIPGTLDSWIGAIAYSLQIYFDFSGYSDMAIGLGLMFGFHFQENFNYPYAARSVTDFWRRWHISLSSWFRDYVYIPLGGNRCPKGRHIFNLFVVWALTGIWHGAVWTFWLWGVYYFVLLVAEKSLRLDKIEAKTVSAFYRIFALFLVLCGWIIFRSPDLPFAAKYFSYLFGASPTKTNLGFVQSFAQNYYLQNGGVMFAVALVACTPVFPFLQIKSAQIVGALSAKNERLSRALAAALRAVSALWLGLIFVLSVLSCIKSTYNPFIYFNF